MRMRILLSLALLTALAVPSAAEAACSNPAGVEGEIILNSDFNVPVYCDDTNWIAMSGGNESAGGQPGNGLVAHWRFDETTSVATTADSAGPNDGTFYGGMDPAADSVTGKFDTAFDFDGSDDEIEVSANAAYNDIFAGGGSISFWIYPRTANTGSIIYKTSNSGTLPEGHHLRFFNNSEGRLLFRQAWAGGRHEWRTGDDINFNQWNHVAVVFDNSADTNVPTIYINNVATTIQLWYDIGAGGAAPSEAAINLYLGWEVDGYLDDVRYYDRELTPADVAQIYNATTADAGSGSSNLTEIVPTGLVGHWRLDETSGTTAYDSSVTGVDLTYSGSLNPAAHSFYGKAGRAIDAYYNDTYQGSVGSSSVPLSIKQSDQITMAAWVKIAADNVGVEGVIRLPGLVEWNLKFSDIRFLFEPRGWTTSQIAWGPTIPLDEWTHIAVSYDYNLAPNTTPVWFVNGVQKPSYGWVTSTPTGPFNPTSNTDIGIATSNYPGAIGDVRIYDRILNEDEVRQIYNARDGIRYNESMRKYEYFDGNKFVSLTPEWKEVDEGVSYDCPNIGDVCSDGSLYAGNASNGDRIYVTSTNLTQRTWKSSAGVDDISTESSSDGRINVANLNTAITNFPAINECDTSTLHGQNDWYLPASGELVILNNNRAAIDANATNAFNGASAYWSSTESSTTTNAFRRYFDATTTNQIAKTATHQIRCIRRAPIEVTGNGGLIGHWKMDETSGTTVYDSSSNGNNGTMTNGLNAANDSQPGAVSTSLAIDGIDDGINIGNPAQLNNIFNGGATISGWAYIPSAVSADSRLLDKNQGGANTGWLLSTILASNRLNFDRSFSGSSGSWQTTASFPRDQWFHYVIMYNDSSNANDPVFFINGLSSTITESTTPTGSADDDSGEVLFLANRQSGNRSLQGNLDDIRIYDRILSSDEIQQLYQMGSPIGSSTALPQGCPNVGDVCDDGTYYAGLSPDGNIPMYAAGEDEGFAQWRSFGTSRATDATDGDGNTALLYTFGQVAHPHAYNCFDKVAHGASDWYWPAQNEMLNIYNGGNPIGGVVADGSEYWTSNQHDSNSARSIRFNTGYIANTGKNGNFRTRCVRKGPAPRCANPYGLEGQMIYNSTHDVVQFCDGARWIAVGK